MPVYLNKDVVLSVNTPKTSEPIKDSNDKTSSFPTSKVVILGSGLAALAAVGIYLARRGRGGSGDMSVETFKKAGNKFVKGQALTKSGKKFTGNITHKTKDGKTIVMEYKDGFLQKSASSSGVVKDYTYSADKLRQVITTSGEKKSSLYLYSNQSVRQMADGSIVTVEKTGSGNLLQKMIHKPGSEINNEIKKYTNGKLVTSSTFFNDGRLSNTLYHPDGKTKKLELEDLSVTVYDKKGEKIARVNNVITDDNTFVPYSFEYNDVKYRKHEGDLCIETPMGTLSKFRNGNEYIKFKDCIVRRNLNEGVYIEKGVLPVKDSQEQNYILDESNKYRQQILEQGNNTYKEVTDILLPNELKQLFSASEI